MCKLSFANWTGSYPNTLIQTKQKLLVLRWRPPLSPMYLYIITKISNYVQILSPSEAPHRPRRFQINYLASASVLPLEGLVPPIILEASRAPVIRG